jgi:hypothetical protein
MYWEILVTRERVEEVWGAHGFEILEHHPTWIEYDYRPMNQQLFLLVKKH